MKFNSIFNKVYAFTMAEVLLVVAVIGITAALALPNLSKSVDEDKYVMLVKSTYSELDTGISRMLADKSLDEIYIDAGASSDAQKSKAVVDELSKYIKIGTNCGNSLTQCYNLSKTYTYYDGSSISGKSWTSTRGSSAAAFTMPSGAVVILYPSGNNMYVDFDVDGAKGSSKSGMDIYTAIISTNSDSNGVFTSDLYTHSKNAKRTGNQSFDKSYDALDWVLSIGNMDYLHCNNLNWSTKHQCD